nr:IS110 family transposase [Pedobacter cryoconitis]
MDISMKDIHTCLSVIDNRQQVKVQATKKFDNNEHGFKAMLVWLNRHKKEDEIPLICVMEATGVYYEECAFFLFKAGFETAVVLPTKAKKYMQALGFKTKNDKMDSVGLACMGAQQCLELWKPLDAFFYTLRALTRHHQSLQELKTSLNNQLHADENSIYSNKKVKKQLRTLILNINKQLRETEKNVHAHLYSDDKIAERVDHIVAIKGIGHMTVATVLGETNGFLLFKSISQLISYAGYDVIENQSGNHKGKTKISKKGSSHIRRVLHMPAFNMIRYDVGNMKIFFDRILARHNKKMKAYVAVQKKLLALIYTLWQKNEEFKPQAQWVALKSDSTAPYYAAEQETQVHKI